MAKQKRNFISTPPPDTPKHGTKSDKTCVSLTRQQPPKFIAAGISMMFILFGVKWLFIIIAHYRTTPYLCEVTYKYDRMRIEHIAIWADDIERLRDFYRKYFRMTCGDKYVNPVRKFTSCFLSFGEDKTRIELMHIPDMGNPSSRGNLKGLAHFAISVGNRTTVDELTGQLRADGYSVLSEPRTTGDGYYESVIADPEGNHVEITE